MFWIREALVVPDDLHAITKCVNRSSNDARSETILRPPAGSLKCVVELTVIAAEAQEDLEEDVVGLTSSPLLLRGVSKPRQESK